MRPMPTRASSSWRRGGRCASLLLSLVERTQPVDRNQPLGGESPVMERRPATAEEARALANPLRLRILRLCLDRELTNEELAARLGKDAGSVLHHVRLLVKTGFLAAEEERRGARGSVERPYRATGKSWILDVGDEDGNGNASASTIALVDAFRAEVAETPKDAMVTTARLGVRLNE